MRRMARLLRLALVSLLAAGALLSPRTWAQGPPPEPPAHARTWIVSPVQGAIVQGPDVTFVAASTGIQVPEQGHYHLLIDEAALHYVLGLPLPTAEGYVHFRLPPRVTVRLTPGPHVVVLVMGNPAHVPFVPLLADARYIFVK